MAQAFEAQGELIVKLVAVALVLGIAGTVVVLVSRYLAAEPVDAPPAQPVPFSHKHHVGDVGLDCRYCHARVETAAFPGLPSASLCLGCHAQLFADAPILQPLRASVDRGRPIAWARVNRLPDYVYFDHSVHIAKNVPCVECHGRVDQMPLIQKPQRLPMKWCMDCHADPRPHLVAHDDVFRMPPPRPDHAEHPATALQVALESRQRLTDCSTCHR